jgi:FAD/FMN-containing dehydrogenase/Fe-S oxidoreductase
MPNLHAAAPIGDIRLAQRLKRDTTCEVLFGPADRGRYATDASIYQIEPVGVAVPRTTDDAAAAMAIAREHGVPVLARGGGTSQCGQTVNRALVLDFSRYLNQLVSVDPAALQATVQPGMVLGHLNAALKPHGLFFPVDPSTHSRCTIGGMAGNNSCGAKSIRYGLMADNVAAIDALLADGTAFRFGPAAETPPARIASLVATLTALGASEAEEIAKRFPWLLRRVGGYNIETLTPAARLAGQDNLARLLVGSEGTLALSTAITLNLVPIKPRKVLGICQFPTFRAAMEAAQTLVELDPEAVELVDRNLIDLGRSIPLYRATIDRMLIGEPDSLLIVEFHGDDDAALARKLDLLAETMGDLGHPNALVTATDPAFQASIAQVREAGLNIMMSMKGDGKPVSFIEDTAVALEDLADYTERLNEVFTRHGTKGTWYAHASAGCLHVRPVLNMKSGEDVSKMRQIAEECFALVRDYKGSHSGEHGDGIVRSEFHAPMFGERIVKAFETVKQAFDPDNLLNPNRIVNPPRMDDRSLLRYPPGYAAIPGLKPLLDWRAHPNGLLGAVEMCNNNGACRGFDAEVLCPSYRVTRNERDVTRGRANTLRLALTGQLPGGLGSADVADALSLCVSCKACRRECPTGVDMARMKIEAAAARPPSPRDRLIAHLPRLAPVAAALAPLSNARNRSPRLRQWAEQAFGLAAARDLPEWRRDPYRDAEASAAAPRAPRGEVLIFADTWNRWFSPEPLRATVRVLAAAGYRAIAPYAGSRPLCCGRTYLAAGRIGRARAEAARLLAACASGLPVIGVEPSCLLTLRDELPVLLPGAEADSLASRAFLLSEFLVREGAMPALRETPATVHIHGHCHQKSFGAFPDAIAMLREIPGLTVKPVTSSCCGMAGSFGYQAETQAVSRAMAQATLLPAIEAAPAADLIAADGFSCRHQIASLSGRAARHSAEVMADALDVNPR